MSFTRGNPDWQKVEAWDSPLLWNDNRGVIGIGVASPAFSVSRWANLGGWLASDLNIIRAAFDWYADRALTQHVGNREIMLTPSIIQFAQLRIPNLGAWVQIEMTNVLNGNYQFESYIFGTNRQHSCEFISSNAVIIDQQNQALAANGTDTFYPSDYYAGPIDVSAFTTQSAHVSLEYLTTAGAWSTSQEQDIAASVRAVHTIIAPAGAWRLSVTNDTANAANIWLRVTPSTTGAA